MPRKKNPTQHQAKASSAAKRGSKSTKAAGIKKQGGSTGAGGGKKDATSEGATSTSTAKTKKLRKAIKARVGAMQAKYGEELAFLVREFTKLEAELAPQVSGDCTASMVSVGLGKRRRS